MAQKAVSDYTPREALLAYGYARDDATGLYKSKNSQVRTQVWRFVEGMGWERFDPIENALPLVALEEGAEMLPFGIPTDSAELPGYVRVPFGPTARFANVGGLHPMTHEDCYEWYWPENVVKEIYAFANIDGREYARDAEGNITVVSKG